MLYFKLLDMVQMDIANQPLNDKCVHSLDTRTK